MIHQCGDADLDPMSCPACVGVPSGEAVAKAYAAMDRVSLGLCSRCGVRPCGEESSDCRQCGEEE